MSKRLPSIRVLAADLRDISANVECGGMFHETCDVRLIVWRDGTWIVQSGPVDYDTSHGYFCGASSVPGVVRGKVVRFDSYEIARDLLDQVRDQIAQDG